MATGFLRNSMINEEGGVDPEQFRMEAMFDRMDAVGKAMLGLTIQCSQCHDHKYDPISQTDYYQMFAFLNNCNEAQATVYTQEALQKREALLTEIQRLETELQQTHPQWREELNAWATEISQQTNPWSIVRPELDSSGGQKHYLLDDGSVLVQTAEDLGTQGEYPSHPELLDWLAVELMDHGWSLKHVHRLIANSATYRQSSHVTEELYQRDPSNRLLARGPRFRLSGEIVRDVALAVSGLLNREVGGPPVYPPAPDFLFLPPASYGPKTWTTESGANRYRRALYTFRFRSVPYPMLQNFDTPRGDAACVRRVRSNTPIQALTTLNEDLFVECSRALAMQIVSLDGDDPKRIIHAFRRCTARSPSAAELETLLKFLQKERDRFAAEPEPNSVQLATGSSEGKLELSANVEAFDVAAWTAVTRVLLNLDEVVTKE